MEDKENFTRVTSVIGAFSGIDQIPKEILEPAAARGTLVHKYIECILRGESVHVIPSEIEPYINSFKIFWQRSSHAWDKNSMELEKRFWCPTHKITGAVDLVIRGSGRTYILDWKTSAQYHKSFDLQGAAYRYLVDNEGYTNTDNTLFVRLNKEGKKPTLHKSETYLEDLGTFFKCLDIYRFFKMEKRKNG